MILKSLNKLKTKTFNFDSRFSTVVLALIETDSRTETYILLGHVFVLDLGI